VQRPCKRLQRLRKRRPFEGFRISNIRRDSILRTQAGVKVTGFAMEAEAETLWSEKIFQGEGRSGSSGGSYNYHRISVERKIWTIEVSRPRQRRRAQQKRADLGRHI
jgi:hypothetical protein